MGRQAFLTRLALGRSAFEPLNQGLLDEDHLDEQALYGSGERSSIQGGTYVGLERRQAASNGEYEHVQQYDGRGYPCNPVAQTRASQLRRAQNDVLAAVGVVKRKDDKEREERSSAAKAKSDRLNLEDTVGASIDVSVLGLLICSTWWLESFRLRFMVFTYPPNISTFNIFCSERRMLGNFSFFMAGLPARALYHMVFESVETYLESVFIHLDRLVIATIQSRARRARYKVYIARLRVLSNVAARVLLSPLFMYSHLQRLYLIPASPKMPHWRSFIPFSESSPFQRPPKPFALSRQGLLTWAWSILTYPTTIYLVLLAIDYIDEFAFTELPRPAIIAPTNQDRTTQDPTKSRNERLEPLKNPNGLSAKLLSRVCQIRNRLLQAVGWMRRPPRRLHGLGKIRHPSYSISPSGISQHGDGANTPSSEATSVYTDALETHAHHDLDPTLNIADFARLEILESQEDSIKAQQVTDLSLAPAAFLANLVDSSLMECTFIQPEAVVMRSLAFAFLSATSRLSAEQLLNVRSLKAMIYPVLRGPILGGALGFLRATGMAGLDNEDARMHGLQGMGIQFSRIGLTWAAQAAVGLSLWGLEWAVVRTIGKRFFGWGKL